MSDDDDILDFTQNDARCITCQEKNVWVYPSSTDDQLVLKKCDGWYFDLLIVDGDYKFKNVYMHRQELRDFAKSILALLEKIPEPVSND